MPGRFHFGLLEVPADGIAPVVLGLERLRSLLADGEFTVAAVINVLRANVFIHIIKLHFEAALLTEPNLWQIKRHGDRDLVLVVTLAFNVVIARHTLDRCLKTYE